jgi:hypothetical protein
MQYDSATRDIALLTEPPSDTTDHQPSRITAAALQPRCFLVALEKPPPFTFVSDFDAEKPEPEPTPMPAPTPALTPRVPTKTMPPLEIVQKQLNDLQTGDDASLNHFFSFCDREGAFANKFESSAPDGPIVLFKSKIRREPRWKSIGHRPVAALLHHKNAEIVKGSNKGYIDESTFKVRVRVEPYFPDAPDAESAVLFEWLLKRQIQGSVEQPTTKWLVEDILPDFGGWAVAKDLPPTAVPVVDEEAARQAWLKKQDEARGV